MLQFDDWLAAACPMLQGDVMCCETCSGVFHAACLGLAAPPAGQIFCPLCTCSVCGDGGNGERAQFACYCAGLSKGAVVCFFHPPACRRGRRTAGARMCCSRYP